MAANKEPIFVLKAKTATAKITGTTIDKTGATPANMVELVTGSTDGTKIGWIKFKFSGSNSAGNFLIWITDSSGLNPTLMSDLGYALATSTTTGGSTREVSEYYSDLNLGSGQKIFIGSTIVTNPVHVTASIGDFS